MTKPPGKVRLINFFPTDIAKMSKAQCQPLHFKPNGLAGVIVDKLKKISELPEDKRKEARSNIIKDLKERKFDGESYAEASLKTQMYRGTVYLKTVSSK